MRHRFNLILKVENIISLFPLFRYLDLYWFFSLMPSHVLITRFFPGLTSIFCLSRTDMTFIDCRPCSMSHLYYPIWILNVMQLNNFSICMCYKLGMHARAHILTHMPISFYLQSVKKNIYYRSWLVVCISF